MNMQPARILITSSSFLDTPGEHLTLLAESGYIVKDARGPLDARKLLDVVSRMGPFDAVLCGDDEFTAPVLKALTPQCKIISKYGVGLDRIDLDAARQLNIVVKNTPGISSTAVAELVFGLLIGIAREIPEHNRLVHNGVWQRRAGFELSGSTIGIVGLGQVGRAVANRALAFGMNVSAFNSSWSNDHINFEAALRHHIKSGAFGDTSLTFNRVRDLDTLLKTSDVVTLHVNLNRETQHLIDYRRLCLMKRSAILLNVSRGGIVDHHELAQVLRDGSLAGYGADVLEIEPVSPDEVLLTAPRTLLTPHIGSRTRTSVQRQGIAAFQNIKEQLERVNSK